MSSASRTVLDDGRAAELRASFPVLGDAVYLNSGTSGPMPDVVASAMAAEIDEQLAMPRSGPEHYGARAGS